MKWGITGRMEVLLCVQMKFTSRIWL